MKHLFQPINKWIAGKKPCSRCGELKGPEGFHSEKRASDGKRSHCKACSRNANRAWEAANPEKHQRAKRDYGARTKDEARIRSRRWHEAHRAESRARAQRRTITHPHQHAAHIAVQTALRSGKLTRPIKCEGCGEKRPLHGHHDDYSKRLEVTWLCVGCHNRRHAELRRTA